MEIYKILLIFLIKKITNTYIKNYNKTNAENKKI